MARHRAHVRPWTPLIAGGVFILAAYLIYRALQRYSLDALVASVGAIPLRNLLLGGVFAACSYGCLTLFDFLATRYVGADLPYRKVALASFTALSLGHTIGLAALSSGAVRLRFYMAWGLGAGDVGRIIVFCGLTVASGLTGLTALVFLTSPDLAGRLTGLSRGVAVAIGFAALTLVIAYLVVAARVRHRLHIVRWTLDVPVLPLALAQLGIGTLNFAFVAAAVHQMLLAFEPVPYVSIVAVYVIANTAAIISHVPGGLGVIEAVVLALVDNPAVIGGLLAFRFVYYLVPFFLGAAAFMAAETWRRWNDHHPRPATAPAPSAGGEPESPGGAPSSF